LPELELTVPQQVTLGLLPERLEPGLSPVSIQAGIDCGMADMCGLDPCLCGKPDAFGACACNGTREVSPQLIVTSGDSAVVMVVGLGDRHWLVPLANGETELSLAATLVHHTDASAQIPVRVDAPLPPFALYAAGLFVVLVILVLACRALWRRGGTKGKGAAVVPSLQAVPAPAPTPPAAPSSPSHPKPPTASPPLAVLMALTMTALLALVAPAGLFGCAPSVKVTQDSPQVVEALIASMGNGTETGQRVEARIVFDRPLAASGELAGDLDITLNDKPLDTEVIEATVLLEDTNTLLVALRPAAGAGGGAGAGGARYFAVYEGVLSVSARDVTGGLAHLTAAGAAGAADAAGSDGASAVIGAPLRFQVPSGLVIEPVDAQLGSAAGGAAARAGFRIIEVPRIRAVSWIELEPGGARALVHNHEFTAYGDGAAGRERYAAYLASALEQAFDSGYQIGAEGDTVTVTARTVTDGQVLAPRVCEGVLE
jgi:hypothetical protein